MGEAETLVGAGESMANPPSPTMCNNVPIGHNSDAHERRSISSRSCDHVSCDPGDSSYDDTGGVHSNRHRKRRRRNQCKEQTTKDQATNTDLSSNGNITFHCSSNFYPTLSSTFVDMYLRMNECILINTNIE